MISRTIRKENDAALLKNDIDNLQQWEKKWKMEFNSDKCEACSISNKRKPINATYSIHGKSLKHVKSAKYLVVSIVNKLSWNTHVDNICKKTNSTRELLQGNTHMCPRHIKSRCFTTYVSPTMWDTRTQKSCAKIKGIQRRSARYVFND